MSTTRRPNGITTGPRNTALHDFILPSPLTAHVYWDDFDTYTAADWTVTEVGVATQALADADGGRLLVTNAAVDNDSSFSQKVGESFLMEAGKKAWFAAKLQVSDATQSDWVCGLQITDTTPLAVTDGIYFRKDDGDTNIDLVVIKGSAATTSTAIGTNVDATDVEVAFYYNGVDAVIGFIDGVAKDSLAVTNLPDDEVLTISFGIQNGEGVAKTMSVDYIFAAKAR
jgi:hypothetical protein